jgi:two-component system, OmpR family, response regulator
MHTILIVEDDDKITSMLKERMEKYEYRAHMRNSLTILKGNL